MTVENLSSYFKAIGDKSRYNILMLLLEHDYCVNALAHKLNLSEAAISQHLKILRNAKLVWGEKRGYFTHYSVNEATLKDMGQKLQALPDTVKKCPSTSDCPKQVDCRGANDCCLS